MFAAVATLSFLVAIWAIFYAAIVGLDDSRMKILAALKGKSSAVCEPAALRVVTVRVSGRYPGPYSQPVRAKAEWRAAA